MRNAYSVTRVYLGGIRENSGRILISDKASRKELAAILAFTEKHFQGVSLYAAEDTRKRVVELFADCAATSKIKTQDLENER